MDKRAEQRRKRGEIRQEDLLPLQGKSEAVLIKLLERGEAVERTAAARLLAASPSMESTAALVHCLSTENSLYPRIEISRSLQQHGMKAFPLLVDLLGKIGTNHEMLLPKKGFEKISYPLPRDIAARCLCSFGAGVLPDLFSFLECTEPFKAEQTLDLIGHIAYTEGVDLPAEPIIAVWKRYRRDLLLLKVLRALSQSREAQASGFLVQNLAYPEEGIVFEALRSLILSGGKIPDEAWSALNEQQRAFARRIAGKIAARTEKRR